MYLSLNRRPGNLLGHERCQLVLWAKQPQRSAPLERVWVPIVQVPFDWLWVSNYNPRLLKLSQWAHQTDQGQAVIDKYILQFTCRLEKVFDVVTVCKFEKVSTRYSLGLSSGHRISNTHSHVRLPATTSFGSKVTVYSRRIATRSGSVMLRIRESSSDCGRSNLASIQDEGRSRQHARQASLRGSTRTGPSILSFTLLVRLRPNDVFRATKALRVDRLPEQVLRLAGAERLLE